MQRFGRPSTPTDQAWIESLFGHVKGEWPQLEKIRDPGELVVELDRVRVEYNTVRLHAGIDYVTPDDEHHGRGDGIRQARRDGLARARTERINYRRTKQENNQGPRSGPGWALLRRTVSKTQKHLSDPRHV
jgi:hypothetical protein